MGIESENAKVVQRDLDRAYGKMSSDCQEMPLAVHPRKTTPACLSRYFYSSDTLNVFYKAIPYLVLIGR